MSQRKTNDVFPSRKNHPKYFHEKEFSDRKIKKQTNNHTIPNYE